MNDEKPGGVKKADGRPFDGGLGPTAKAAGGVLLGQPQLSADQLHGDPGGPSWKAPSETRGISNAALIAIIVVVAIVVLILLRVTGAI